MSTSTVTVNALILWTRQTRRVAAFYRLIGLPLEDEDHGDGHAHQACDIAGVHVAVYDADTATSAPRRREGGALQIGFKVPSLELVANLLREAEEYRELVGRQKMDWGVRVVVEDPDGRPVELTEA